MEEKREQCLQMKEIVKQYGITTAVNHVTFCADRGDVIGLVGANGAGKSTLLRIINDIYKRDSGSIEIDGVEVANNEELKQKLVFVPDDLYFFPNYTLQEMANFYKSMYKNFDM